MSAVVVLAALTVPRLPPGICRADSGDLQVASVTLGIPHPPGYGGYVTLGYLVSRFPGVDPAYLVSLACLGSGLAAVWLCMLTQVRLGGNAWLAAAIGVALTGLPRVWQNLLAPEVYLPSLAFMSGSAYVLLKYARLGRRRDLMLAGLLLGTVLANRPATVFALPFFVVAWMTVRRRWEGSWRRSAASLMPAIACLVLPGLYSLGYLWVRDAPGTVYNYIEQYNAETGVLPPAGAGPRAKLRRVIWHAGGAQFRHLMGNNLNGIKSKLRWLRRDLRLDTATVLVAMPALILLGWGLSARRCRASAWLLVGMVVQPIAYVCTYRVYGQAADLLPLIWAGAVGAGVAVSRLLVVPPARVRLLVGVGLLAVTSLWTAIRTGDRPSEARAQDALAYIEAVDLATFPSDAVICASWGTMQPLSYAKHVLTGRSDINIINAAAGNWARMVEPFGDRPVFYTAAPRAPEGFELRRFRKLWRLVPEDTNAEFGTRNAE